jgi:hypothetical protein
MRAAMRNYNMERIIMRARRKNVNSYIDKMNDVSLS